MDEDLKKELTEIVKKCSGSAKRHYFYAHLTFTITVLASFLSAIFTSIGTKDLTTLGLSETETKVALTILAALPAAVLLINNTMRFEERTKWFWKKARKAERLLRELKYQSNSGLSELAKRLSDMSEEMENEWPGLGTSPSQPKKDGK